MIKQEDKQSEEIEKKLEGQIENVATGDEEDSLDPNFIKAQREGERRDALDCPPKSRLDRFAFGFEIPVVGNDNSGAASVIDG